MTTGIYQIRNTVNNKVYVGRASYIEKRRSDHFVSLQDKKHKNRHLQKAYDRYGKHSFVFEVLQYCLKSELVAKEHFWCLKQNSHNPEFGYNLALTGLENSFEGHCLETRLKMSKSATGRKMSKESIEKMRQTLTGRKLSETAKEKLREWHRNNEHPMKKGHTEEAKLKISKAGKGRISKLKKSVIAIIGDMQYKYSSLGEASNSLECLITSITNNLNGRSLSVKTKEGKAKFIYG